MQKEFPTVPDTQRKQEDDARRYNQLLAHPRDAHHLFALLLAHQRTNAGGVQFLNGILDQLHLQDLVKEGQLATNRAWQAGAVDGRSGTEIAADKMIAANMAIVDAQRARRQAVAQMFDTPIRDPRVVAAMPVETAPAPALLECEECKGVGGFVEDNGGYQTEQTGVRCDACKGTGHA